MKAAQRADVVELYLKARNDVTFACWISPQSHSNLQIESALTVTLINSGGTLLRSATVIFRINMVSQGDVVLLRTVMLSECLGPSRLGS